MKRLSNRTWIGLMLAVCLVVSAATAGLALTLNKGSTARAAAPGNTAPTPQPGSAQARADLTTMQSLLSSGSVSKQAALLVPPFKFVPGSKPIFPAGTPVTIHPGTFRSDGQFGIAQASAGGKAVTLGLYSVQGHWHLYAVKAGAQTRAAVTAQPGGPVRASLLSSSDPYYGCPDASGVGIKTPVILIHGYKGGAFNWTDGGKASMFSKLSQIPGVYVLPPYDYSQYSTRWVTDPHIGPAFADYIHCVATASAESGGPGKVIVVAHSMGGLATRFAATTGGKTGPVEPYLAKVITIGTPNTGAPLANAGSLLHSGASLYCGTSQFKLLWTDTSWCQDHALAGMSVFGPEIAKLPELPSSIPLDAIAGDASVRLPIGDGQQFTDTYSDGLVPVSSALHLRGGSGQQTRAIVSCHARPDLRTVLSGPCAHASLPGNQYVQQRVIDLISAYLKAHPAATPSAALGGDAYWLAGGGQWYVHGSMLQISRGPSGLTGMMSWNAGGNIVTGHLQMTFVSQPDGSLAATFTSDASYTERAPSTTCSSCNFRPPSTPEALKGQTITLVPIAPMHAKEVYGSTSPPGWIAGAAAGGNTNWCQDGLDPVTVRVCGA